ncbi:hypothetical protein M2317_002202 [Microbacterium sp. ZKA21]|uniref:hypothetical protein n=1 Tax=Microbacterium sp. ZKA21 TaxID=3381694 RepID=UPI003D21CBE5
MTPAQETRRVDSLDNPSSPSSLENTGLDRVDGLSTLSVPEFWDARPDLATIRDFSLARRVAPWSTLGIVLCRVIASTPPEIRLPPLVGGYGSANLFIGIVGTSGRGKGTSTSAATALLPSEDIFDTIPVGSGEGIPAAYVHRSEGEVIQHQTRVLFDVAEVDTLTALGRRVGSTLMPVLRQVWSGEALGFQNIDPTRRLLVPAHTYRAALIVGIQPERAFTLLDDSAGGTPQRFLWLPGEDPAAPNVPPKEPAPLDWAPPIPSRFMIDRQGHRVMQVCTAARADVDADRLQHLRGHGNPLDAHAMYARLKVATALALLDRSTEVREDDWELARVIMAVSNDTRREIRDALADAAVQSAVVREQTRALVKDRVADDQVEKAKAKICGKASTEWQSASTIKNQIAVSLRPAEVFDAAVDGLVAELVIEVRDAVGGGTTGRHIRLRVDTPSRLSSPAIPRGDANLPSSPLVSPPPASFDPDHHIDNARDSWTKAVAP